MSAPNKWVVTKNFLGMLTRGDVVTTKELPADPKALLAEGSIRAATAAEQKGDATWVDEPDTGQKALSRELAKEKRAARATNGRFAPKAGSTGAKKSRSKKGASKATGVPGPPTAAVGLDRLDTVLASHVAGEAGAEPSN